MLPNKWEFNLTLSFSTNSFSDWLITGWNGCTLVASMKESELQVQPSRSPAGSLGISQQLRPRTGYPDRYILFSQTALPESQPDSCLVFSTGPLAKSTQALIPPWWNKSFIYLFPLNFIYFIWDLCHFDFMKQVVRSMLSVIHSE